MFPLLCGISPPIKDKVQAKECRQGETRLWDGKWAIWCWVQVRLPRWKAIGKSPVSGIEDEGARTFDKDVVLGR